MGAFYIQIVVRACGSHVPRSLRRLGLSLQFEGRFQGLERKLMDGVVFRISRRSKQDSKNSFNPEDL
jgi:hypothetical protein